MRSKITIIFSLMRDAARRLLANDPLRMAAATAFFTTFALPPIIIVIVRTFGVFFDKQALGRGILGKVGNIIGHEGREQILTVIKSVIRHQFNPLAKWLIFIFLLFVATTLFMVVKNSINQLWNIHLTQGRHIKPVLISRAKAIGIILFTGVLFMLMMAADVVRAYLSPYFRQVSPAFDWVVISLANHIVSLLVVTAWFYVLFRFLPDGRPRNSAALTGAALTGLLFSVGKYVLQWMLSGRIQQLYGNAGALVLILLFVFYSALMLYYGAAFTKVLACRLGKDITPLPYATIYHLSDDEVGEVKTA